MFEKGEYLVAGNKGVCLVEDITTLDISGVDKKREYYILKPVYSPGSTVYVPIDSSKESLRKVLTHEEADSLIRDMAGIPLLDTSNDKLLEQEYRDCVKANNCEELVRVIKTIYVRKQKRIASGRKETAIDAKYFRLAEESLYGELAIVLGMPKEAVAAYITGEIEK